MRLSPTSALWLAVRLVLLLALGCAGSQRAAPPPTQAVETPPPVDADAEAEVAPPPPSHDPSMQRFTRDLPTLPKKEWASADGRIRGEVESFGIPKSPPHQRGGETIEIPIGTAVPIQCGLHRQRIDAAASLWKLATHIREPLQLKSVSSAAVEAMDGRPALFAEFLYSKESTEGNTVGLLKAAVLNHPSHSLLCTHDEPGYSRAFARIVGGFFASLKSPEDAQMGRPKYSEVQRITLDGRALGYTEKILWAPSGGKQFYETFKSLLIPSSPNRFVASDEYHRDTLDSRGNLLAKLYIKSADGTAEAKVTLQQQGRQSYRFAGTRDGKTVTGTFKTQAPLSSDVSIAEALKQRLLSGKAEEAKFYVYNPTFTMDGPVEWTFQKSGEGARGITLRSGNLDLSGQLDAEGYLARYRMKWEDREVLEERLALFGAP